MKKTIFSLLLTFVIFSCTQENQELTSNQLPQQKTPLTAAKINSIINDKIDTEGDFNWSDTNAYVIWSAAMRGDSILTVGYGTSESNFQKGIDSDKIKKQLLDITYKLEHLEEEKAAIFIADDAFLNVFDVKVKNIETVEALLENNNVRYLEPSGYQYFNATSLESSSGSGCGFTSEVLSSQDYRTVAPNAKIPWSFDVHNIPKAWNYSTGSGITIGLVDTGISPQQSLLNANFNDGYSSGRYVQKYGTYVDSWWYWSTSTDGPNDKCGHGTSMASVATAPRNNDGQPVGVAYNANLVSYRATKNVVIDTYHEKKGVANALTALANRSDVKIISMSIGYPFSIGRVKDAVKYAYNRGKLIFAAGGTSTSYTTWYGVIFPANMAETIAVTGIKESGYQNCDVCHSGAQIDFTVTMQRSGTNNTVPVLSYYNGQSDYVGGSSVATATTAGIAALVWAKHPSWSRSQVLSKLKQSAAFYPNKSSSYGYGNIDALKAVQ